MRHPAHPAARHLQASVAARRPARWMLIAAAALISILPGCRDDAKAQLVEAPAKPLSSAVPVTSGAARIDITAEGFVPDHLTVEKGKPAKLTFVRTTDQTCAKQVVFPELKLKKDLPLNQPVEVDVPTDEARKLVFQCGMGMYKSALVVQ